MDSDLGTIKILVLFYSFTGHTARLAQYIAEGAREIDGVEVTVKQVPELIESKFIDTLPKVKAAKEEFSNIPFATIDDLTSADGVAFGTPVHFGSFASQIKQFIDSLSPIYIKGSMAGKPAACFVSAGTQHGGAEAALISLIIPLLNLGMIPVGVPYPIQGVSPGFDAGSPYGAVGVSGHIGEEPLTEGDIKIAKLLGKRLGAMTKIIKDGSKHYPDSGLMNS